MRYEVEHDSKVAGYIGEDKTIKIIKHNWFWLGMNSALKTLFAVVILVHIPKDGDTHTTAYFPH
jgi:hypothetical protein